VALGGWQSAEGTKRKTRIGWMAVYALSDLHRQTGQWPQSWMVVDWPEGDQEPFHIYLACLKTPPTPKRCLRLSRGRFAVEHFFQRDKTNLGMDHYEGWPWQGFHHHLVLPYVEVMRGTAPSR
jgi:hypothetical protein